MSRGRKDKPVSSSDQETQSIGAAMRLARQEEKIALTGMAAETGYSKSYLSTVENGVALPSVELVETYENRLGLEKGKLLSILNKQKVKVAGVQAEEEAQEREGQERREDWGELPIISNLYGREKELQQLKQWMGAREQAPGERKQVIAVLGLGGIGKTVLVASASTQVKGQFDYIFWRSLQNAPSVESIIREYSDFIARNEKIEAPNTFSDQMNLFMQNMVKRRCLLMLDNLESVFKRGEYDDQRAGEYTGYSKLLQDLGEREHGSCIVLTSREKPGVIEWLEAKSMPVGVLQLTGLALEDAQKILREKGLAGTDEESEKLIERYQGNPLALKLVSECIREVFGGDVTTFLEAGEYIFGGIHDLLEQQFERLSDIEREIMYWMGIGQEEVSLDDLQKDLIGSGTKRDLLEAIGSLQRRFLIEKKGSGQFILHPVILEYVTDKFVEEIGQELESEPERCKLLRSHALIKAQSKEYIRNSQIRVVLEPIADRLRKTHGKEGSKEKLNSFIEARRKEQRQTPDYLAGNILNLLIHLKIDLRGADFSHLSVRQAYLQGVALPEVNFASADLEGSVFTDTFGSILTIALSADEEYLAAGTASGVIRIWRAADSKPLHACEGHKNWVRSVAFSPDGSMLASGSEDKTIRLWDVRSGQCLGVLEGHSHRVRTVIFSPYGRILASSSDDQSIRLWDVDSGQCLGILEGHSSRVRTIAFSPKGSLLASGSDDQSIRLWNPRSKECREVWQGHSHRVRAVVFSPDGHILASSGDDKSIRLWNVESAECIRELQGHTKLVRALAFNAQGDMLASGSEDQSIRLWDLESGQCSSILREHTNAVRSLIFAAKSNMLISGSDDQTIRFWLASSGQCLKTLQGHSTWTYSVAFSPDGSQIASGSQDQQVRLWDISSGRCLKTFQGHQGLVYAVAFSPDGSQIVSGSQDQQVRLWDISSGRCLKIFSGHRDQVNSVAFSPDGSKIASGSEDNTVRIWEVSSRQTLAVLRGHRQRVRSVVFSPDGSKIASGSEDNTVRIWEVESGRCLRVLEGHKDQVRAVAFNRDGTLLVSGSEDHLVCIWEMSSGQRLKILAGHSNRVRAVAFSPDGKQIASGSEDSGIRIWETGSGCCLMVLEGHQGLIYAVAFNPVESMIVSGSYDGTMKLWNTQTGECLQTLRSEGPYEGMKIVGATGLTENQKDMLRILGAVGDE